jgi:GDP-L-fucose synthase
MVNNTKIYISGHRGMVGSAIKKNLINNPCVSLVLRDRNDLDLTNQLQVQEFFEKERPDEVYLCAARVGGIYANNTYPAEFIYENLMIQSNIIHQAFKSGVKKLLFLGSSCIYPKNAPQPIKEESLLTGLLEPTNEPYAIAKIAGIKLCESYNRQYSDSHKINYRSVMPTNLYGPGDNYHLENSHVIPGLLQRFHHAKINNNPSVKIWGTGKVFRDFLHVDDMARACLHLMKMDDKKYNSIIKPMISHINIGSGNDIMIFELANLIAKVVGYNGAIETDDSKSDGPIRKLLDISKLSDSGWEPSINLEYGLKTTYQEFYKSL